MSSAHRRSDAQDDLEGVRQVSLYLGFSEEKDSEAQVTVVLFIRERRNYPSEPNYCKANLRIWTMKINYLQHGFGNTKQWFYERRQSRIPRVILSVYVCVHMEQAITEGPLHEH